MNVTCRTLVFFRETGCPHCEEALPYVRAFAAAHPHIRVQEIDLAVEDWPEDLFLSPESIPSYADLHPFDRPRTVEGRVLTKEEIESWFFQR